MVTGLLGLQAGPGSSRELPHLGPHPSPSPPRPTRQHNVCLFGNKIMLRGEMRDLIGFKKPQEPMELQMVEGPGGWDRPRFYGGECGLGVKFTCSVSNLISQPSGTLLPH